MAPIRARSRRWSNDPHVTWLTLNRLGSGSVEEIVTAVAGDRPLPEVLVRQIAERAEQHEVQRLLADLTGHVRAAAPALARSGTSSRISASASAVARPMPVPPPGSW